MVKITNGKAIFEVSSGAFEDIYKKQGFYKYEDKNAFKDDSDENEDVENADVVDDSKIDDSKSEEELLFLKNVVEKPLSEWTKGEVKKFAKINNIDIVDKSPADVKKEIKVFMNEK